MLPISSMFGSFQYGPEAVLVAFMIPVFILWFIGIAVPGCGKVEQMAYGLLRLYWRIMTAPFRWLGRTAVSLTRRGAHAGANATRRGAWWLIRRAAGLTWRGIRWSWQELVYRVRRASRGRNYRRP